MHGKAILTVMMYDELVLEVSMFGGGEAVTVAV